MNAIILVGGGGTRLRPFTLRQAKPMIPLVNRPLIETLFVRLAKAGVECVVLSACYQVPALRRCLRDVRHFGLDVRVAHERVALGTAGAIRYAWPDSKQASLVLNGDILSGLDLNKIVKVHRKKAGMATLWTMAVKDPSAFGVIESHRSGKIQRFIEKPKLGQTFSRSINAGLYVMEPEVLDWIKKKGPSSVEREVFPAMLRGGVSLAAWQSRSKVYWRDVGSPDSYLAAHLDILQGRFKLNTPSGKSLWASVSAHKNVVGHGSKVASSASIDQSCLGAACQVSAAAQIRGSLLWDHCQVGQGARIEGAILGRRVQVGEGAVVSSGSRLGDGAKIPPFSRV